MLNDIFIKLYQKPVSDNCLLVSIIVKKKVIRQYKRINLNQLTLEL